MSKITSGLRSTLSGRQNRADRSVGRQLLDRLARQLRRVNEPGCIRFRGCTLPPRQMRQAMCGGEYASDDFFLDSGIAEARRLVTKLGSTPASRVVEIGSGLGRLVTGLLHEASSVQYWGFDASGRWVAWCKKYIERFHPSFRFVHVDVQNDLYNPNAPPLTDDFRFPLREGHADIVYTWGVFTNMRPNDARIYISEISRLIRVGGVVFLTAFVEDDVPDESVNPSDYVNYPCEVPLHVVRYDKRVLFGLFAAHGLRVEEFGYHAGTHCHQSEIYLRKDGLEAGHIDRQA